MNKGERKITFTPLHTNQSEVQFDRKERKKEKNNQKEKTIYTWIFRLHIFNAYHRTGTNKKAFESYRLIELKTLFIYSNISTSIRKFDG